MSEEITNELDSLRVLLQNLSLEQEALKSNLLTALRICDENDIEDPRILALREKMGLFTP